MSSKKYLNVIEACQTLSSGFKNTLSLIDFDGVGRYSGIIYVQMS